MEHFLEDIIQENLIYSKKELNKVLEIIDDSIHLLKQGLRRNKLIIVSWISWQSNSIIRHSKLEPSF